MISIPPYREAGTLTISSRDDQLLFRREAGEIVPTRCVLPYSKRDWCEGTKENPRIFRVEPAASALMHSASI
jgi:hypothetical protein